jgi:DNA (cytosine-5)-methyltransferase 1
MTWRTLDLFCGAAGGWSLGLHRAGFTTVAACEIDPWRRAVFSQNNPGVRMYDDIRTLDADRLLGDLGFLPDIICGSPPCQDASTANTKGRGVDGERTGLFFDAVRLVREVRPRWVLLENVPGLRARGYDRVHDALEEAGYTVWPFVVGAVHAGAPHLRKRVWIIAADLPRVGRGSGRPGRSDPGDAGQPEQALHHANAAPMLGPAVSGREPDRIGTGADANAAEARREPRSCGAMAPVRDEARAEQSERLGGEIPADTGESDPIGGPSPGRRGGLQEADAGAGAPTNADETRSEECRRAKPDGTEHSPAQHLLGAFRHWNGGPPDLGRVDDGLSEALASRRGLGRAILAAYGDAVVPQITEAIGRSIKTFDQSWQVSF